MAKALKNGKWDDADRVSDRIVDVLNKSQMGLPSKAKKGRGAVTGSYPMNDKAHARLAKAYATRFASPAQKAQIDAKANRVLGRAARSADRKARGK